MKIITINDLKINQTLYDFINKEVLPGTDINQENFWKDFSKVVHELSPINKSLLEKREKIQKQIDEWHLSNSREKFNKEKYTKFLKSISYLKEEGDDFKINTANVDDEIAKIAGPQLVVPVDNARYALNAANARWGSLYDSLYGTDVIPGEKGNSFNKDRADKVVSYTRNLLDEIFNQLGDMKFRGIFSPHMYGEPLLDPRIVNIISSISKINAKPKIVTNGDYLNLDTYKLLLKLGVKIINISKHSKDLSDGCNELLEAIKNKENSDFKVTPKVFDFWKDFKEDSDYLFNRGGDITIKEAKWNPIKCVYASYPVINVYGDLILCCQDYHSDYVMGNIMENTIYEIWQSPENQLMRERIMRSYFDNEICKNCLFSKV